MKSQNEVFDDVLNLTSLLKSTSFQKVDLLLKEIDVTIEDEKTLVSILRITFPLRFVLKHWSSFLDKVRVSLLSRNLDVDKILRGL